MKYSILLPVMLMMSCQHVDQGKNAPQHNAFDIPVNLSLKHNSTFNQLSTNDNDDQHYAMTNTFIIYAPKEPWPIENVVTEDFRPGTRDLTLIDDWQSE
jgi:hypothetical protein